MLDVMLIDDDMAIRERLKSMIDWEGLGLTLTCEAADSEAAMELYLYHRPKVVVTDINIPIISGLELARKLLDHDREIRLIIITGYSDFEYVRGSVALGAVDLLRKPLSAGEINESLRKAVDYFENLRREKASVYELSRLVEGNLPQLRESFMAHLLSHRANDGMYAPDERLEALKLDIKGAGYAVVILSCDLKGARSVDVENLLAVTRSITDELLTEADFKHFAFYDDNYRLNCAISWNCPRSEGLLEEVITSIHEKMMFIFNRKIYAGIGQPVEDLRELHLSARQARMAYNYQGVLGSESVINYQNVKRVDAPVETDRKQVLNSLEKLFRMNNATSILSGLHSHFAFLVSNTEDPLLHSKAFAFEYAATILSVSFSLGIDEGEMPEISNILSRVFSCDNISSLTQYIWELTEKMLVCIFSRRSYNQNQLICLAQKYIEENIGDKNLDLDSVSDHIGLSSKYFCRLFHKEAKVSFNQYLNERRISLAKDMLKGTSKKVFEICYELGYGNPKYFSFAFKRMVGLTPLEYRGSNGPRRGFDGEGNVSTAVD